MSKLYREMVTRAMKMRSNRNFTEEDITLLTSRVEEFDEIMRKETGNRNFLLKATSDQDFVEFKCFCTSKVSLHVIFVVLLISLTIIY